MTVIGASTTQLFRNLSFALSFPPGSEIVLSKLDHEANLASWVSLAKRQSLTIKWWTGTSSEGSPNSNPRLTPESLQPLLSDKTVFVACTHASNILGTIHPIKSIASTIHTHCPQALFCVDAVAYAPHRCIDVLDLGVDFYAFSWYKVYGPHIAQLYASPKALQKVESLGHFFNPDATLADKLGLAASSYELVAAIPAVVNYFHDTPGGLDLFWNQIKDHEEQLQKILLEYLNTNPAITILGEPTSDPALRVATISFIVMGRSSREIVEAVDRHGDRSKDGGKQFGIRWGHFYSKRLCEEVLGLGKDGDGVVRVSMVHYNTEAEVRGLVEVLRGVVR